MNRRWSLAAFAFALALAVTTPATAATKVLPDSCGDPLVTFTVATTKPASPPAKPADGKAQIVLIQTKIQKGMHGLFGVYDFTARFGLDGKWLGAAKNNSYFTADIDPGEHHVCTDVQNTMGGVKNLIGMKKFTAEAGKIYYFQFAITKVSTSSQNSSDNYYTGAFEQVDEDEGAFRVKALQVSSSTPEKTP